MLNSLEIKSHIQFPESLGEDVNQTQQVSIDLRVKEIHTMIDFGKVFKERTSPPIYKKIPTMTGEVDNDSGMRSGWMLHPGIYSVIFHEGIEVPSDIAFIITHRSSILRCGGTITSGIYDPGFKTKEIGAFLNVVYPLFIEEGSRIATTIGWKCSEVNKENIYNGQWQNGKNQ